MNTYLQQINCRPIDIDLEFWRAPQGVSVPDDELNFLLVPDAVEARIVFDLSQQVHRYQLERPGQGNPITCALMATMGGMLPGILLSDHLGQGRPAGTPRIEFGTIGISFYKGPNERYGSPRVKQDASIPVADETVLIIDDLGDRGDTLKFITQHLADKGARQILTLALYMKPAAMRACPADFFFGEVQQDTWIITPREMVETMASRVPVWKERGADEHECYRRLVDIIGYPKTLVDYYLRPRFTAG
jgi:hypoxanthine phosphoribosyltransferase